MQMPGWTGLANARVTMFGDVYQLADELQEGARQVGPGLWVQGTGCCLALCQRTWQMCYLCPSDTPVGSEICKNPLFLFSSQSLDS